ncbi:MAG: HpcH/HpaI aldolase/citrate lyase family protein [Chitinispirillaceae bacterium]
MRYDYNLDIVDLENTFFKTPQRFDSDDKQHLSIGLGAVLYIPGTKENLCETILKSQASTVVVCLEDAIDDSSLKMAHHNVMNALEQLKFRYVEREIPFIFIRGRNNGHFKYLAQILKDFKELVTGFVLPKFEAATGEQNLVFFRQLQGSWDKVIYLMPILETGSVLYKDNRFDELLSLKHLFCDFKDQILNIRIGATDMSGLYGIRRPMYMSVWDNALLQSVLGDIINYFIRKESGFVVSGPVWEYYRSNHNEVPGRYSSPEIRGLVSEVELDMFNGLLGKSVIHPSQIMPVLSRLIVSFADYMDASTVIKSKGGVSAGYDTNRMNERNPHLFWAEKIIRRSKVYGVFQDGLSSDVFLDNMESNMSISSFNSKNIQMSNNP